MNVTEKYACPVCQKHHQTKWDAEDCCPRRAEMVLVCGECGVWYFDHDRREAEDCCKAKVQARQEAERIARTCVPCGVWVDDEAARDSKLVGSVMHCRACLNNLGVPSVAQVIAA